MKLPSLVRRPTVLRVVSRTPSETNRAVTLYNKDSFALTSDGMPVLNIKFQDGGIEVVPLVPFLTARPAVLRSWADHYDRETQPEDDHAV